MIKPVVREGGNFIEQRLFGGSVTGWWKKNEIGNFNQLRQIGVMTGPVPKTFGKPFDYLYTFC